MITRSTLQHFCASDERPTIAQPWSDEQWSYASDGRILLRVPRLDDVPENPESPKMRPPDFSFEPPPSPDWLPMPEFNYHKRDCNACSGRGKFDKCPSCRGRKYLYCECFDCGDVHEYICPACGDTDEAYIDGDLYCMVCEGTGRIEDNESSVLVKGIRLSTYYLNLIRAHLTDIQLLPLAGKPSPQSLIRFDGGMGYLIGMR